MPTHKPKPVKKAPPPTKPADYFREFAPKPVKPGDRVRLPIPALGAVGAYLDVEFTDDGAILRAGEGRLLMLSEAANLIEVRPALFDNDPRRAAPRIG